MLNITTGAVHSNVANSQGYTGKGIGVALIDSGMSDMAEFHNGQSRIVYQQSFVQNLQNLTMNCPGSGAQAGAWFSSSLNLQGGLAPYMVSITSGTLPAGLTLNAATGAITGVPLNATLSATSGAPLVITISVVDSIRRHRQPELQLQRRPGPQLELSKSATELPRRRLPGERLV